MARLSDRILAVILLLVYGATLLVSLNLNPLWLDEIQQFASVHHSTLGQFMLWVKLEVGASPLPYLLQRFTVGTLGYSVFAARLPAALCSVLCGAVFAMLAPYFLTRGRVIGLAMFLLLPLQFRYGVEGRVYSQGLLLVLLSMWQLLRMWDRPTPAQALLYFAIAAGGMYSQPLMCFPLLAEALYAFTAKNVRLRYSVWIAVAAALLAYIPWFIAKQNIQHHMPLSVYFFSLRQITPAVLLHDLAGGGYAPSIALLLLACWPSRAGDPAPGRRRLLLWMVALSMIGPIAVDAVVQYYFAARQNLFALPALIFLAAQGYERLEEQGRIARAAAFLVLAVFVIGGAYADYRLATIPRDDLDRTAQTLAASLPEDGCLMAAPREQAGFYTFLRPELENKVCGERLGSARTVIVAVSSYTNAAQRKATLASLPARYQAAAPVKIGQAEILLYRLH